MFAIAVVEVWRVFMRPANLAARERQEQREHEQEREQRAEKSKLALTELDTFHWQEKQVGGDMLDSVDVYFPRMKMSIETVSRYGGDESTEYEVKRNAEARGSTGSPSDAVARPQVSQGTARERRALRGPL